MIYFSSIQPPTLVSEGSFLQGDIEFHAFALIFGKVEGSIEQNSAEILRVGKSGWVRGDIRSEGPIVIEGRVDGNVYSMMEVRVLSTATIRGNIYSPTLEVRPGAEIDGEIQMKHQRMHRVNKAA